MGKIQKKLKHMEKLAEEKLRATRRTQLLAELKNLSIDKNTSTKLQSVVTSNQKSKKKEIKKSL